LFANIPIKINKILFPRIDGINKGSASKPISASNGTNIITKKSCTSNIAIIILPFNVLVSFLSDNNFITIVVDENDKIVPTNNACSKPRSPVNVVNARVIPIIASTCINVPIIIGFPIFSNFETLVSIPIENNKNAIPSSESNLTSSLI
jgi:hypothetical protein